MTETEFAALTEAALAGEPALHLNAAAVIKEGRRVLRRRALATSAALTALLILGAAGVAALRVQGSSSGEDRLNPAASTDPSQPAPTSQPRGDIASRFEDLLRQRVQAHFPVTGNWVAPGPAGVPNVVIPGVPHRVSLALGDRGWVSLLTGPTSPFQGNPCTGWMGPCTANRAPDGTETVERAPATPSGWHSLASAVTVVLPNGHWVSATASNAPLDGNGTPGSVAKDNPPIPLDLAELRDLADAAASDLR